MGFFNQGGVGTAAPSSIALLDASNLNDEQSTSHSSTVASARGSEHSINTPIMNPVVPFQRGNALLKQRNLERFFFLIDKSDEPRRHLLQVITASSNWAPRDCTTPCSTYEQFSHAGFSLYHVVLSLVGYGSTPYNNPFAKAGYSYIHMPFMEIKDFLQALHPDDRYIAYVITETTRPIHIYFDIDADFEKLPHLKDHEEECIKVFWILMESFFSKLFGRKPNRSGLLLLQASSENKMSWHMHLRTEAFVNMEQLRVFVQEFRDFIQTNREKPTLKKLPLCVPNKKKAGGFIHIVDFAPYMRHQNLRAPYNQKPGKTPLRVRKHQFEDNGELTVLPKEDIAVEADVIQSEVLFHAHPSLALPTEANYVHLTMESTVLNPMLQSSTQKKKAKRKAQATDDEEEENELTNAKTKRSREGRESLTDQEIKLVKTIVSPHLGRDVRFDVVYRCGDKIKGECTKGTANCPNLRKRTKQRDAKHASNRMSFTLRMGEQVYHCFDEDCKKNDKIVFWDMDENMERLLRGAAEQKRLDEFTSALIKHTNSQSAAVAVAAANAANANAASPPPAAASSTATRTRVSFLAGATAASSSSAAAAVAAVASSSSAATVSSSAAAASSSSAAAAPSSPPPSNLSWW